MIPDISNTLTWLENNAFNLKNINRGIERETLRVEPNGNIAISKHPKDLGSALKNEWITTDFAESLLEFITPVDNRIEYMLSFLRDIHRYVCRVLDKELLWPLSMPCRIEDMNRIKLANYGKSNIGLMKTLYRKGLKTRYGAIMQTISGVHYNFSLPVSFWKEWANLQNLQNCKETISLGYLSLIRNYYRFGWIIPYLFGASPAICSSFLEHNNNIKLSFKINNKRTLWLPYATSLRLSDLGYNNKSQNILKMTFNSLEEYVNKLKIALKTPWKQFVEKGIKDKNGNRIQLNTNILQIENEFYSPIRPKCIARSGESYLDALMNNGIEYIEVRSLDINPFSAIGVNKTQVCFLDLFLIWCMISDISKISFEELYYITENWRVVTLEGRKPNQKINIRSHNKKYFLADIGKEIFHNLHRLAEILDKYEKYKKYQKICDELFLYFDNPELTYSARILNIIKQQGIIETGISLSRKYRDILCAESLQVIKETDLKIKAEKSILEQQNIENSDFISFESYLDNLV
ncbi:glutamate--cysteine ligase [Candidatus Pantoea edessiphila]|uniref:Glutamate--cysteine ligase n=1 Tax=Candidatus Pantoea edessiphila TaxID=2044610 RepID=A0A2P5SXN6_9GAMM|nr:glutamate--cysteine ligase [Candidatus Pantoea edessiphila]MBK4775670.1 glutamate--cysteine ligase [Pantoea sp. Edef]PPI87099.1 glutamate--cysteine ligase [Candidatus Pantoea edessiphila]